MTSTWNALTGLPSIFPRQDWLKFSLLHQYHNALGGLERTPSKKRAFYALMPSSWMATGLGFFYHGPKLFGPHGRSEIRMGRYLLAGVLMEGPEAVRSINGVHQPEGCPLKTSESADLPSSHGTSTRTGPILNSNQNAPGTILMDSQPI